MAQYDIIPLSPKFASETSPKLIAKVLLHQIFV